VGHEDESAQAGDLGDRLVADAAATAATAWLTDGTRLSQRITGTAVAQPT